MIIPIKHFQPKAIIIIIILSIIFVSTLQQQWYEKGNPHFINQNDFQQLVMNQHTRSKGVTFIKYFTPWCRYCKFLKDIVQKVLQQGQWNIKIYQVNCDGPNYQFCGMMGVRSFPKLSIFQNGTHKQSMDGFYPYPVIKDLFVRYNKTIEPQIKKQEQGNMKKQQQPTNNHVQQHKQQIKNQVEPTVVQVKQQKPVVAQKQPQPQKVPEKQTEHIPSTPSPIPEQINHSNQPKKQNPPPQNQPEKANPQTQSPPQTQQMLQQKQNIAIMDQNKQQIQSQKKIIQQIQKKKSTQTQTIDLTTHTQGIIHNLKSSSYTKYLIYLIILMIGIYYFIHIMKGEPQNAAVNNHVKNSRQTSGSNSSNSNKSNNFSKSQIKSQVINKPSKPITIQQLQLNQQIHFQHPNHEEQDNNSCQDIEVNDQDL